MDIWPVIHDERKALAADLKGRSGEEWDTASLCGSSPADTMTRFEAVLNSVKHPPGRQEPLGDLTGDGVAALRSRS